MADLFAAHFEHVGGERAVELAGPGGARCLVLPGVGSQLASLRLCGPPDGQAREVLHVPAPAEVRRAGLHAGAPVLFPWPGRITRGEYAYRGGAYRVQGTPSRRHPLHGFVSAAPWDVVAAGADRQGAWVRTRVAHAALGVPPEAFPGDYVLELTHRLGPAGYAQEVCVRNVGDRPFPFGYGWHPYFRVPMGPAGRRADCVVRLPASARWELTAELVPTGRRLEVAGPYDLRPGSPLGDKSYDDPFTLLTRDAEGVSHAELIDPLSGVRLTVSAGPAFQHWVVYAPRTLAAVCLEPYTCVPDAFNLEPRGIPTGLLELEPGSEWCERIAVRLDAA